jgi:hypothetical protein
VHVMLALLDGLAATGDSRATDTLLAESRPGIPKRVRLRALAGLASMKAMKKLVNSQELIVVTEAALRDPFFPIQEAGQDLVGAFGLIQFRADIEREAQTGPTIMQRAAARKALEQLEHNSAGP